MADRFSKDTAQQRTYRAFEITIAGEDSAIDLARAALLIASIEYPDLDIAYFLAQLDALARRVRTVLALPSPDVLPQLPFEVDLLDVLNALNKVLIEEERFHGNEQDYYNPQNSFLNKVLEDRMGIPITLSLVYIEVGRRVGLQLDGIGLPFHFMVKCSLPERKIYIDPFAGHLYLSEQGCVERVREIAQRRIKIPSHWFEPISRKFFLVRILTNLKIVYIDQEDYAHALAICDLLLLLLPEAAIERRDRGHIHLQLKHYSRAIYDLGTYIELAPQAEDRYEILNQIKAIRQIIAMMN